MQRKWLKKVLRIKYHVPVPSSKYHVSEVAYRVVSSPYFDWFIFLMLIFDLVFTITFITVSSRMVTVVLQVINYGIVSIYMAEAILKVHAGVWVNKGVCLETTAAAAWT